MDARLIRTIRDNDAIAFKRLIDRGANPLALNKRGYASVHLACIYDSHRILDVLLDRDPSIIYQVAQDESVPIELAVSNASLECLRVLSRHAISLDFV